MSRVRTADQFLRKFRELRGQYEKQDPGRITSLRNRYTAVSPTPMPHDLEQLLLESHSRAYLVDLLLQSLNWTILGDRDSEPNLIPEAPVRSADSGTVRFFDYLGLEGSSSRPLLIVETKRPGSSLPQLGNPRSYAAESWAATIAAGLRGEPLSGAWNKWLQSLRDYVRSAAKRGGCPPRRVVLTDGNWLVVFTGTNSCFMDAGPIDQAGILVLENRDQVEQEYARLFRVLEYYQVVERLPPVSPGELRFYTSGQSVRKLMHGLRLIYYQQPTIYGAPLPKIRVAPLLLLVSESLAHLVIEKRDTSNECEVPREPVQLVEHLKKIRSAGEELLEESCSALNVDVARVPATLKNHYYDHDAFDQLHGVREYAHYSNGATEYIVATGHKTHYLDPVSLSDTCPYHDWGRCQADGVALTDSAVSRPSAGSPLSSFVSGDPCYCAHRGVFNVKMSQVNQSNRKACGPRSGEDGQAFCEIAAFEECLCCRACSFLEVCSAAAVFLLPCGSNHHADTERGG